MKSPPILSVFLIAVTAVVTLGSRPAQAAEPARTLTAGTPAPVGILVQGPTSIPKANLAEGQAIAGWLNQTDPTGKTGQSGQYIYLVRRVTQGCNQYSYYYVPDINPATGRPFGWILYGWANICSD